jgi:hypothetical protein
MSTNTLQLAQFISSIATPVVILLLGLKINKTLEVNKATLAKDKEWRTEWAKRFYSAAIDFNSSIEECIFILFSIGQNLDEKLPQWEQRIEEKQKSIHTIVEQIQRAEWSLKTAVEFAPSFKNEVLAQSKETTRLVSELLAKKQGDLEAIRITLFAFNKAAMFAHREILGK